MKKPIILLLIYLAIFISLTPVRGFWTDVWVDYFTTPNFVKIKDVNERKRAFFNYLLPIAEKENKKVKIVRTLIENNQFDNRQIKKLAKKYRLKNTSKQALLNAVDIIPNSLILAQAAIESNWGRSRFARRWHNYFGIWCFKPGCGIIPKNRDIDAKHEVMEFSSTSKAVEYYLLNINRNYAYDTLRQIRNHKRRHNLKLTGKSLSEGLGNYSGVGYEYIELVQGIIRQNNLARFD